MNNWETAFELAFILYLDIINLLLKIIDWEIVIMGVFMAIYKCRVWNVGQYVLWRMQ